MASCPLSVALMVTKEGVSCSLNVKSFICECRPLLLPLVAAAEDGAEGGGVWVWGEDWCGFGKTKSGRRPSPRPRDRRLACIAALTPADEVLLVLEARGVAVPAAVVSLAVMGSWAAAKDDGTDGGVVCWPSCRFSADIMKGWRSSMQYCECSTLCYAKLQRCWCCCKVVCVVMCVVCVLQKDEQAGLMNEMER